MRLSPRHITTNILNIAIYIYIKIYKYTHITDITETRQQVQNDTKNRMCKFCFLLLLFVVLCWVRLPQPRGFDFPHMCRCGCRVLFYPLSEVGHTLGFKMSPRSKSFLPFALLGLFRGHFTFSLFHLLVKIFCKLQKLVKYTPSLFPRVPSHTLLRFK